MKSECLAGRAVSDNCGDFVRHSRTCAMAVPIILKTCILLLLSLAGVMPATADDDRPNVILVFTDDV